MPMLMPMPMPERGRRSEMDSSYTILNETTLTEPEHRYKAAIRRMEQAGFTLAAVNGTLRVKPSEKLSPSQRDWVKAHKAELLAALAAEADPNVAALVAMFDATVGNVEPLPAQHTPVSVDADVEPQGQRFMRPYPVLPGTVRCVDCRHGRRALPGDEVGAWRLCEVGKGGYFALARHYCDGWECRV